MPKASRQAVRIGKVLRRDDGGDDDVVDLLDLPPLRLDDGPKEEGMLVGRPLADGRQARGRDEGLSLEEADDGVRVPDVEGEEKAHPRLRTTSRRRRSAR